MVSAAIDVGVSKLAAATIFSTASLASIVGRIGTGVLADRFGSKTILVTWLFMQALAVLLYLLPRDYGSFTLLAVYFGFSFGGVMPLYAVVTRDLFGERAMGASYGGIFFLSCIGMGIGAWAGAPCSSSRPIMATRREASAVSGADCSIRRRRIGKVRSPIRTVLGFPSSSCGRAILRPANGCRSACP